MEIKTGKGFKGLVDKAIKLVGDESANVIKNLDGTELSVGFSTESGFGTPESAAYSPIFMGDSNYVGEKQITASVEAALKANADSVQLRSVYNPMTKMFDQKFSMMPGDASPDFVAGQLFSPWNITYLSQIWKQPMEWTNADKIIRREHAGANPFAEIFTLFMRNYKGWGAIGQTGSLQNTTTNDVNVMDGMMSFPIINMMATYSVTLEEQRRSVWGPAKQSPLSDKQQYLKYVMDMMDAILIYYGNEETHTQGIMDINPIREWNYDSCTSRYNEKEDSSARGSKMYNDLADCINDFLDSVHNKYRKIKIALSPLAYNKLRSMTYSTQYSAQTVMETFRQAYQAGDAPLIEFIEEPLLSPNTEVNPNPFDYMVISAPEIGAGPANETQPTNFYATVLDKFVFPVIPGMYNTQYRTLRRVAGVIAPIPDAVRVYSGFGVKGDE